MEITFTTVLLSFLIPLVIWQFVLPSFWKGVVIAIVRLITMLVTVKIHSLQYTAKYYSFVDVAERLALQHPDRVQFISVEEDRKVTAGQLNELSNQIAQWASKIGIKHGDAIALMMLNRPELVAFWMGIGKLGAATALINTNTTGKALLHTVTVATQSTATKIVVIDHELRELVAGDEAALEAAGVTIVYWDELEPKILSQPKTRPETPNLHNVMKERDALVYIYTSGTTGLPKASKISHSRFLVATVPFHVLCQLNPKSCVYNCLPLYHSAGCILGVGAVLRAGSCMVLRRKFSVRTFSSDCVKYNCNVIQYIGELCRYLLTAPPNPNDNRVRIKYAFGNGLRPDVWEKFQKRYHVDHIVEIYASTEGNFALFNNCDLIGAIGFVPRIVDFLYPVKVVKMDPEHNDMPYRDPKTGRVVPCASNEIGLLICEIDNSRVDRRFEGYTDKEATEKKIVKDVFRKGDMFFNTGDLVTRDFIGFFYWSDRTGDTFRWKGENVATTEVAHTLAAVPGVEDVTVYGVEIPGYDGRCGMAAITLASGISPKTFDWHSFHKELSANLPHYARPLFIRFKTAMQLTGTFKHQKGDLVKEGFNPSNVKDDPLFLYNTKSAEAVPLTLEIYQDIVNKKVYL